MLKWFPGKIDVMKFHALLCSVFILINSSNGYCEKYEWELLGPGDADQVTSLNILHNGDVVAGFDIGGIYLSTDNGNSWSPINNGLNNLDVTTKVTQDARNPEILYVGTRGGLFKSVDHGQNWKRLANGLPEASKYTLSGSIGGILIDRNDSNIIYTALGYRPSSNGTRTVQKLKWADYLYKSDDGGNSWKKRHAFPAASKVTQLYQAPAHRKAIYASTSTGLYSSEDGGDKWIKLLDENTLTIAIPADKPNIIYAACNEDGIFRSDDYGKTWEAINEGLGFFNYSGHFGNRYSVVQVNPLKTGQVFLLNSTWGRSGGLYRSDDAGNSWKRISNHMPESWLKTSSRMNDIAISDDVDSRLFLGSSRYLYTSADAGNTWIQNISRRVDNGWTHTGVNIFGQTRDVLISDQDSNTIYVGTADHGMLVSTNNGSSWNTMLENDKNASNVWDMSMCPAPSHTLYIVTSGVNAAACVMQVNDNKLSRKRCDGFGTSSRSEKIAVSPHDCKYVYLSINKDFYISQDAGDSWTKTQIGPEGNKLYAISFTRSDSNAIYAGTQKGLYYSGNKGRSWSKISHGYESPVTSISIPDDNDGTILIGTMLNRKSPAKILRSTDNGKTWHTTLSDIVKYVSAIKYVPGFAKTLIASTLDDNYHDESKGSGIFISRDNGTTWKRIDQDLPVYRAYNLSTNIHAPGVVYLSSNGSGVYRLDLGMVNDP